MVNSMEQHGVKGSSITLSTGVVAPMVALAHVRGISCICCCNDGLNPGEFVFGSSIQHVFRGPKGNRMLHVHFWTEACELGRFWQGAVGILSKLLSHQGRVDSGGLSPFSSMKIYEEPLGAYPISGPPNLGHCRASLQIWFCRMLPFGGLEAQPVGGMRCSC